MAHPPGRRLATLLILVAAGLALAISSQTGHSLPIFDA